jgi:phosphoserine phosphatase
MWNMPTDALFPVRTLLFAEPCPPFCLFVSARDHYAALWNLRTAFLRGSKEHEIVAIIAETHLTSAARRRIKELLPQGTTLADVTDAQTQAAAGIHGSTT